MAVDDRARRATDSAAGRIKIAVGGHADGELHRAPGPPVLGQDDGARDGRTGTGNRDLARCVEVHRLHNLSFGRRGTDVRARPRRRAQG